ncbi:hypothetical protein QQG55_28240 [Brugia pahangi]
MLLPEPICESPSINLVDENASGSVTLPMRSVVFDLNCSKLCFNRTYMHDKALLTSPPTLFDNKRNIQIK